MKYSRILLPLILTAAILAGSLAASAAEQSGVSLQIVAIEEVPQPQTSQSPNAFQVLPEESEPVEQTENMAAQRFGTAMTEVNLDAAPETAPAETSGSWTEKESAAEKESESESESVLPRTPKKLYEITSALDDDYVLDIRHCTARGADDQIPQLYHSLNVDQQKFYLEPLQGGFFRICALHTGDALTVLPDDGSIRMVPAGSPQDNDAPAGQSWRIEKARYGYCYIKNKGGQYLTLDSFYPYSGASLIFGDLTGGINQMWKFAPTKKGLKSCADTDLINPYGEDGRYNNLRLSLLFGTRIETVTAADLSAQITENEEHQLVLDPNYLTSFVEGLAAKYDTQGQPVRFRTSLGDDITLYEGDFGWKLDTDATIALLQEYLETDQIRFFEPVWSHKGWTYADDGGVGDSYVEVDLTRQRVFLYKDGKKLLETDCVSGTESDPERDTPGGVYSIYYMNSPDTLNGPGYSEDVTYWMAFYKGYGLHDATWRDEFGGSIYKTDGSHGCINLPLDAAGLIYKTVCIGYPVVLYNY